MENFPIKAALLLEYSSVIEHARAAASNKTFKI